MTEDISIKSEMISVNTRYLLLILVRYLNTETCTEHSSAVYAKYKISTRIITEGFGQDHKKLT
jgi:hypothetical protein